MSLAIGREGQNVRLAHRLTGWKIDIKSESQAAQMENNYKQEAIAEEEPVEKEAPAEEIEPEKEQVPEENGTEA